MNNSTQSEHDIALASRPRAHNSVPAAPAPGDAPLFRLQAIEYAATRQYGTVLLSGVRSHRLLTSLFLCLALALIAFFILFSTARKAQCLGVLLPTDGVLRVVPGQAGVVIERRVREGQSVRAGDVLFVLSGERSTSAADLAQKTVSSLIADRRDSLDAERRQARLQSQQRIASIQRRAGSLALEIGQIGAQIKLQFNRLSLSEQAYQRYSSLQATNFISAAQLQERQAEVLDQRQRLADLERALAATTRDHATAEAEVRDMMLQMERESQAIERNISVIDQDLTENESRRDILVRAQRDGMVTAITTERGQTVAGNAVLASLLPAGSQLEAEIYAPSRSAGFIKPGMLVHLRYQAYPYQKFGQHVARVREIAHTSLRPDELALPSSVWPAGEPVYRVRLVLDQQSVKAYGVAMPLKAGMLVEASVILEKRRLYEWVLEPLFSISGRTS